MPTRPPQTDQELRATIRRLLHTVSRDTYELAALTFSGYVDLNELEGVSRSCFSRMGTILRLTGRLKASARMKAGEKAQDPQPPHVRRKPWKKAPIINLP